MILEHNQTIDSILNESVWDRMRDNQKRFYRGNATTTYHTSVGDAKRFMYDLAKRAKSFISLDYTMVSNRYDNINSPLFIIDEKVDKVIDDLDKKANLRELNLGDYSASFGYYTENGRDHYRLIRIRKLDKINEYSKFTILLKVQE